MQDPELKYNPRAIYEGTETYESRAKVRASVCTNRFDGERWIPC
jgi:hypothetical protein